MDRNRAGAVLLALLGVLALSVGAASLDSATSAGSGAGAGPDEGVGAGEGERFDLGAPNASAVDDGIGVPPILFQVALAVLFVLALLGLVPFYEEYGLRGIAVAVALTLGFAVVVFLFVAHVDLAGLFGDLAGEGGLLGSGAPEFPGGGAVGEIAGTVPVAGGTVALAVLLVAVVAGAALVILRASGDATVATGGAPAEEAPAAAAVGRAAGRAAARIEAAGTAVDNEVYRAWREMTGHLDVANPEAATPAEFADAAVAAGMDREDVAELTALFEEVRYGDAPPTEAREGRALAALRRIEAAYADGQDRNAGGP